MSNKSSVLLYNLAIFHFNPHFNHAGLSFLGFGVQLRDAEWGAMLLAGQAYMQSAPHIMIFSGLAILITVLAINGLAIMCTTN